MGSFSLIPTRQLHMKKPVTILAEINWHFVGFSLQPSTELAEKLNCIPSERGYPSSEMRAEVVERRILRCCLAPELCSPQCLIIPQGILLAQPTNNASAQNYYS